jgi:hypothetical protein
LLLKRIRKGRPAQSQEAAASKEAHNGLNNVSDVVEVAFQSFEFNDVVLQLGQGAVQRFRRLPIVGVYRCAT